MSAALRCLCWHPQDQSRDCDQQADQQLTMALVMPSPDRSGCRCRGHCRGADRRRLLATANRTSSCSGCALQLIGELRWLLLCETRILVTFSCVCPLLKKSCFFLRDVLTCSSSGAACSPVSVSSSVIACENDQFSLRFVPSLSWQLVGFIRKPRKS